MCCFALFNYPMASRMTSHQFMQALPNAVRGQLPPSLRKFKSSTRAWLCQLYYADPRLHYEVWNLGERRGPNGASCKIVGRLYQANKPSTTNAARITRPGSHIMPSKKIGCRRVTT